MPKIRTANKEDVPALKKMWQEIFHDSLQDINLYFEHKITPGNSLVYEEIIEENTSENDNKRIIAAMLFMWPYDFSFYHTSIPLYYLAGLATHPDFRKRGIMSKLILRSFNFMKETNIPLCSLVPASNELFNFYESYGFVHVFHSTDEEYKLDKILADCSNKSERWEKFNKLFNQSDNFTFKVLKSEAQFETIWEDEINSDFPQRRKLDGMARIIDVMPLLKIYAKSNKSFCFILKVAGDGVILSNNDTYFINKGDARLVGPGQESLIIKEIQNIDIISLDIKALTNLLFSSDRKSISDKHGNYFPKVNSIMDFMLE